MRVFEKQWNSPCAEKNGLSSVTVGIQHPPKKPKLPKLLKNVWLPVGAMNIVNNVDSRMQVPRDL